MSLRLTLSTAMAVLLMAAANLSAQNLSNLSTVLAMPDGTETSVAELGAGNVTIVSFSATWCVPCKKEMQAINEIYSDLVGNNIVYVSVFIDDMKTTARVGPYVKAKGFQFPVLLDPGSELFELANGTEVPYTLVYSTTGELRFKHDGFFEGDEEHLFEEAMSLVHEASAGDSDEPEVDTTLDTSFLPMPASGAVLAIAAG